MTTINGFVEMDMRRPLYVFWFRVNYQIAEAVCWDGGKVGSVKVGTCWCLHVERLSGYRPPRLRPWTSSTWLGARFIRELAKSPEMQSELRLAIEADSGVDVLQLELGGSE